MAETTLRILLDLIERLPLPLMLQSERGELIAQNRLWQEQCLSLRPLCQPKLTQGKWVESHDPGLSIPEQSPETPIDAFSTWTNIYQQTQIGVDADDVRSTWNLSYIPLGTFVVGDHHSFPTNRSTDEAIARPTGTAWRTSAPPAELDILWLVLAENHTQEERITQELAARNADLIQLNRLKDEFLACITHELKTPLTAILGLSSLLKDQLLGTLNERQSRYAQMIYQSGRQLMKVVNDILDLTRLETGQIELMHEPVQIQHVCDRAIAGALQLQGQPKASPQSSDSASPEDPATLFERQIGLEIEPGLEWVIADEPRLRQMLINLLSNALKFTNAEDTLGLRVNRWQNWVAFSVWDTGIGIPENKQALIFQKFQQLEHPLTRQYEGIGLGLVITKLLARLHGGDVSFISQEGNGSTFTVLLPYQDSPEASEHADTSEWHSLLRPSEDLRELPILLIAHTNPNDLIQFQEQANRMNVRMMVARSGFEALEKTRRLQPAALILNPTLPLLSGRDVVTLLKADPITQGIPLMLLTSTRDQADFAKLPVDAVLPLPLDPSQLQRILHQLLQIADTDVLPTSNSLLTIIRLVDRQVISAQSSPDNPPSPDWLGAALDQLMQTQRCQVLEIDDFDQADMLARIWQPQLFLVETLSGLNPPTFVDLMRRSEALSHLPLISFVPSLSAWQSKSSDLSMFCYELPDTSLTVVPAEVVRNLVKLFKSALKPGGLPKDLPV